MSLEHDHNTVWLVKALLMYIEIYFRLAEYAEHLVCVLERRPLERLSRIACLTVCKES